MDMPVQDFSRDGHTRRNMQILYPFTEPAVRPLTTFLTRQKHITPGPGKLGQHGVDHHGLAQRQGDNTGLIIAGIVVAAGAIGAGVVISKKKKKA